MTEPLDRVFAALADPIRRDMVARLATGDATVRLQYGGAGRPERRYRSSGAGR